MVENPHNSKCDDNTQKVSNYANIEIRCFKFLSCFDFKFWNGFINIKFKAKCNKDTWNNNISQTKHTELFFSSFIKIWEDKFDWNIKIFSNSNHDISSINPENIIKEQCPKKNKSNLERAEIDRFESNNWEKNTKNIVQEPMLSNVKQNNRYTANSCCNYTGDWDIKFCEIEIFFQKFVWVDMSDDFSHWLWKVDISEKHAWCWNDCGEAELQCDEEVYDIFVDEFVK